MKTILFLFALIILASTTGFSQNDSILAFKLERLSNKKTVFLNPEDKILVIAQPKKNEFSKTIRLNDNFTLNNESFLYKSDTVKLCDIIFIKGYDLKYRNSSRLPKALFIIAGSMMMLYGIGGRLVSPYGGSSDPANWNSYSDRMLKFKIVGVLGFGLTISGIAIFNYKKMYDTKNGWKLTTGYSSF